MTTISTTARLGTLGQTDRRVVFSLAPIVELTSVYATLGRVKQEGCSGRRGRVGAAPDGDKLTRIRSILQAIELRRKEAELERQFFTAPPEDRLGARNSAMIIWQSWSPAVTLGATVAYSVGIANPTPTKVEAVFAHVFVGAANIVGTTGQADPATSLGAVDPRFSRLTLPRFGGLTVGPGETRSLSFSLGIPVSVERTNYLGNCFLFMATWHDPGRYLDRSLFVFELQ